MIDLNEIKNKIKGEVLLDEATRKKFSRDAGIFEVVPSGVIYPKDKKDVSEIVKWVAEKKTANPELSITARSAGTDMSGGAVNDGLILDFTKYINKLYGITSAETGTALKAQGNRIEVSGFAEVEPGMFYRDFEKATLEKHLLLPCYTASKSLNTVGGMAANNSAGEKTLTYGQTKDYIEELEMVLSDGNLYTFKDLTEAELEAKMKVSGFEGKLYRELYHLVKENYDFIISKKPKTSKNSAGYLLWEVWDKKTFSPQKLLAGSQGTLGLITKIKYRLVRPTTKSKMLVMFLSDLKILGELVDLVGSFKPETMESYDNHTLKLALRFLPGLLKKMRGGLFSLLMQFLPEAWMTLTGGIPKLIIIAEFTGEDETVIEEKLASCRDAVEKAFNIPTHITKNQQESEKYWTIRRESFSLLRQHVSGLHTAPFIDDIAVLPKHLPEFLPRLNKILDKYPSLIYTIAGHAGDGNFHIIPLMDFKKADQRAIIPKLSEEVYSLVLEYEGTITAEHNDGLIRTPFLEKMYGPQMTYLFAQVKKLFDPQNIFNPRKKVGGDIKWAMQHMIRD